MESDKAECGKVGDRRSCGKVHKIQKQKKDLHRRGKELCAAWVAGKGTEKVCMKLAFGGQRRTGRLQIDSVAPFG